MSRWIGAMLLLVLALAAVSCAGPSPNACCADSGRDQGAVQKWEYKMLPATDQEKEWNQLGEAGWEYVATIQQHNQFSSAVFVFKRPKAK